MSNHDIELTIENEDIFLTVTYECKIRRYEDSDGSGRRWWEAESKCTLVQATLYYGDDNDEIVWHYGENKPPVLAAALERHEGTLDEMLEDEITELINSPSFGERDHYDED
jgi:hypothetical protein